MRLMTFATVFWMRQLRFKLIYMYEIWQMWHMTYDITKHFPKKTCFLKIWFSFCMECKFNFLKENFLFVIISVENRVFMQEKNLTLNTYNVKFFKKFSNKSFFKIMFSLWMECKFEFKNNFGFFCKFYNFFDFWQMRLMTFATVLWIRQLRFKSIYRYEIWQMRHIVISINWFKSQLSYP